MTKYNASDVNNANRSDASIAVIASADRVLDLDLATFPASRERQFFVGWLRHAMNQAKVVAHLHALDLGHSAGPNRRSFYETVLRFKWLAHMDQEKRPGALDSMIQGDREGVKRKKNNMEAMRFPLSVDISWLDSLELSVSEDGAIRHQSQDFTSVARSVGGGDFAALYLAWSHESAYTHASGEVAVSYAPGASGRINQGRPKVVDPDLFLVKALMAEAVQCADRLLVDSGVPKDQAGVIKIAFDSPSA